MNTDNIFNNIYKVHYDFSKNKMYEIRIKYKNLIPLYDGKSIELISERFMKGGKYKYSLLEMSFEIVELILTSYIDKLYKIEETKKLQHVELYKNILMNFLLILS